MTIGFLCHWNAIDKSFLKIWVMDLKEYHLNHPERPIMLSWTPDHNFAMVYVIQQPDHKATFGSVLSMLRVSCLRWSEHSTGCFEMSH